MESWTYPQKYNLWRGRSKDSLCRGSPLILGTLQASSRPRFFCPISFSLHDISSSFCFPAWKNDRQFGTTTKLRDTSKLSVAESDCSVDSAELRWSLYFEFRGQLIKWVMSLKTQQWDLGSGATLPLTHDHCDSRGAIFRADIARLRLIIRITCRLPRKKNNTLLGIIIGC